MSFIKSCFRTMRTPENGTRIFPIRTLCRGHSNYICGKKFCSQLLFYFFHFLKLFS